MKRVAALALVAMALLIQPVTAQSPEDTANDISNKVMSPYCPGVTLHDCPSPKALDLRDDIEDYAARGMTETEIMNRLEADFGPSIRAEPSSEGAGVLAWILPSIGVALGAGVAWMLVQRWLARREEDGEEPQRVVSTSDERERLDYELRRVREQS